MPLYTEPRSGCWSGGCGCPASTRSRSSPVRSESSRRRFSPDRLESRRVHERRFSARCICRAGWEASVYLSREGRKLRRTFAREAEAKTWRADALKAASARSLRTPSQITVEQAAWLWLEAARTGAVRDRSGHHYKPGTLREYGRALSLRVLPEFGDVRLADLTRAEAAGFRRPPACPQARGEHDPQHDEPAAGDLPPRRSPRAGDRQPDARSRPAGGARATGDDCDGFSGCPTYCRRPRVGLGDLGDGLLCRIEARQAASPALLRHRPRPIRDHSRTVLGSVRGADCPEVEGRRSHGADPCGSFVLISTCVRSAPLQT